MEKHSPLPRPASISTLREMNNYGANKIGFLYIQKNQNYREEWQQPVITPFEDFHTPVSVLCAIATSF